MLTSYGLVRNRSNRNSKNFPDWQEFETCIARDPEVRSIVRGQVSRFFSSCTFGVMRRLGRFFGVRPPYEIPIAAREDIRIAILGGTAFRRCTDFILKGKKAAYLYDPTPPWATAERVARFVEDLGISVLFVPHPEFCDRLNSALKSCQVHFIPEAIDPSGYLSDEAKTIDLLAYGRKFRPHHEALLQGLPPEIHYHHTWLKGRENLLSAMGKAKIIINFPRKLTHEDIEVEMVTMRYFQAMASKALILGRCPPILKKIFGYDPVIAVDHQSPCTQVESILANYSNYKKLIERNHETMTLHHTYSHRWQKIKEILLRETGEPVS